MRSHKVLGEADEAAKRLDANTSTNTCIAYTTSQLLLRK